MMPGTPLLHIPHHGLFGLVVERNVVRIDAKDLVPAGAAGRLEREVDVGEGLVDLGAGGGGDGAGGDVPAACLGGEGVS